MITGVITKSREAIIKFSVFGPAGGERSIEAVVDTGFDGSLSLPPEVIARLDLPWRRRGRAILADGRGCVFDIYEAMILWDGQSRRIPVDEADSAPLVGMSLLDGFELVMQIRSGGEVRITQMVGEMQ